MDSGEQHSATVSLSFGSPDVVIKQGVIVHVAFLSKVSDSKIFVFIKEVSMKPIFSYALLAVVVSVVLIAGLVTLTEDAYASFWCSAVCADYNCNCDDDPHTPPPPCVVKRCYWNCPGFGNTYCHIYLCQWGGICPA